jgi:hypothetical protein
MFNEAVYGELSGDLGKPGCGKTSGSVDILQLLLEVVPIIP